MSPLVRVSFDALVDPASALAVKVVATSTLLSALEQGVDVPTGAHMAV